MASSSVFRRRRRVPVEWRAQRDERAKPARPRRGARRLLVGVVLLVGLVWAAPILVAHSPLLGWVIDQAAADLEGSVSVESASLGWFSPPRVSGVKVVDRNGELVIELPAAEGEKTLLGLVTNLSRLGTFQLDRPTVHVELRDEGSNIEELIAKYLAKPTSQPRAVDLKINDGTVLVRDRPGATPWTIEKLQVSLSTSAEVGGPMALAASGVLPGEEPQGRFDVQWTMDKSNRLVVQAESLALARLEGLMTRAAPGTHLAGSLSGEAQCTWGVEPASPVSVKASARVVNLDVASSALGADRVRLANFAAETDFNWQADRLVVAGATADCELGKIELAGQWAWGTDSPGDRLAALAGQTFEARGRVDLARLAAMLPETLHIHRETQVRSGTLWVELVSRRTEQGMVWQGSVKTSDLTALRRGRELVWQQPIVVTLDAAQTPEGPEIKDLRCESQFLTVRAAGRRQDLGASIEFDLDRLAQRLDGFFDLSRWQMAGNGWANLHWRRDAQNQFTLQGDLQIRNLKLAATEGRVWREENVIGLLSATGRTKFTAESMRVETAQVELRAGTERLVARLTKPIDRPSADTAWPLAVNTHGELAHWADRAKAWGYLDAWQCAGVFGVEADVTASTDSIAIARLVFQAKPLRLEGTTIHLDEPSATLTLAGQYQPSANRLLVSQANLETAMLGAEAAGLIVGLPEGKPMELAGEVRYRGDLARLHRAVADPRTPAAWSVSGRLRGEGRLKQVDEQVTGWLDTTIEQLALQGASKQKWAEPEVRLVARGAYDRTSRLVKLDEFKFTSGALAAQAQGQLATAREPMSAEMAGQLDYDVAKLTALLQPYTGTGVYMVGRGSRPFSVAGPLALAEARASAGLGWSEAFLYGFRVGPGELKMNLARGVLQAEPLDLAVSQGRVQMTPRLRLAPEPTQLEIDPGRIIDHVQIDPQMCAYGLQYIAPVLAGVAAAQGSFSIELDECVLPIDSPSAGRLAGRFTVHSVEVGPGPLVYELAVLLQRAAPAKLKRESVIPFRMANGRIHHEGLELVFPELTLRTRGSVGLDQTLALVAEMPIPPKWTAGNATLADALRNQRIQVPLRGTLAKPMIDHQKLDQYNRQFIRQAAGNMLEGEINRQLNRLLQPPKQ